MYPGGQCVNTCAYAGLNGTESAYLGKFGNDSVAECVKETLDKLGVDYSHSRTYKGENGYALVTLNGNDRVFLGGNRLSYDESLKLYEYAIMCNELAAFKESRKAYTYLKRGWAVRGKLHAERDYLKKEEIDKFQNDEKVYLKAAYDGFMKAISEEDFPIAGMEEHTLMYLCAALANRLGMYREAISMLSRLMTSRSVNPRVKDKAYDLKEIVSERLKEQERNGK